MSGTTPRRKDTKPSISRRTFLRGAAAVTAFSVVPRHVLGGAGFVAPSEKINVAIIGTGGQGIVNMKQLFQEKDVHIAALCDINPLSDYSMFYYGGTAGLKPALDLVTKQYGQACPTYHDYEQMLATLDLCLSCKANPLLLPDCPTCGGSTYNREDQIESAPSELKEWAPDKALVLVDGKFKKYADVTDDDVQF